MSIETEVKTEQYVDVYQQREAYECSLRDLASKPQKQENTDQLGFDKDLLVYYSGSPRSTQVVAAGERVYRHYTHTQDRFEKIKEEEALKSGKVPYAVVIPGGRYYYWDLKGAFITTPDFRNDKVGVGNSPHYLDFSLPEDLPLMQLESGIFLIPNIYGAPIRIGINFQ